MKVLLVLTTNNVTIRHCLVRECINRSEPDPYLRGVHGSSVGVVLRVIVTR